MNIFATSECPTQSALWLDDKRVVKMCLETAQILSTALRRYGVDAPYGSTHQHHPAVVWAGNTRSNFMWTASHGLALCKVYAHAQFKIHKCKQVILDCIQHAESIPAGELTPFANCAANQSIGVSFKHIPDVHEAYRLYLCERWKHDTRAVTFRGREKPTWYTRG